MLVKERIKFLEKVFEVPEDHGSIVRCLTELNKLPKKDLNKLTLIDLIDTANSMSFRWEGLIDKHKSYFNNEK